MLALTPKDKSLQDCKIAVQRLKYQRSSGDFDRLAAMTGNALGRWGRLGAAIDVCRSKTAGPFRRKGLSDLMAGLMLVPLFRRLEIGRASCRARVCQSRVDYGGRGNIKKK